MYPVSFPCGLIPELSKFLDSKLIIYSVCMYVHVLLSFARVQLEQYILNQSV